MLRWTRLSASGVAVAVTVGGVMLPSEGITPDVLRDAVETHYAELQAINRNVQTDFIMMDPESR